MNILRVIYDWPDENNITTGLAPAPYELSISQAKIGHTIYVLCGNLNGKNIKNIRFKYKLPNYEIYIYNLPRGLKYIGPFFTSSPFALLFYLYLKITKKIDIIHNHGHMGLCILVYKKVFSFLDKTPLVGHFHISAKGREDILKEQSSSVPFLTKNIEFRFHKFSDYLQTKVAKHLIAVSIDVKEEIIKYYNCKQDFISVIESGVNTSRLKQKGESVKTGFSEDSIILGNIGYLSKRKRIHLILQALTALPVQYKLCLWGTWDKDYQKELSKLIKKSNLKERVQYFGEITYFENDKAFRSIDIFLLPSSYEGLPKVVLEALACGNKVIASGFKTKINIDNLYLQEIKGVNDLISLIKKVSSKKSKYKQTWDLIKKYYSWDAKAKEVELIYNKVV